MARERYLYNAGEETINKDQIEITTKKEKRENFWFYHKWHVLIAIVVAIILSVVVYDLSTLERPDYEIALMTEAAYPEPLLEQLEEHVALYGEDLNGDGKVEVRVNNYQFFSEQDSMMKDPTDVLAGTVKFSGDTKIGSSMIFMMDEASFESIKEANDGSINFFMDMQTLQPVAADEEDYSKVRIPFPQCKGFDDFVITIDEEGANTDDVRLYYFDSLYMSMRVLDGTDLEGDEKIEEYHAQSAVLFERLVNGADLTTETN